MRFLRQFAKQCDFYMKRMLESPREAERAARHFRWEFKESSFELRWVARRVTLHGAIPTPTIRDRRARATAAVPNSPLPRRRKAPCSELAGNFSRTWAEA